MPDFLTIAEAARHIAAKQLSPVELTRSHLDRIRRLNPKLNAFLLVTEERALADAQAAEARKMAGTSRGRLDGIPIAHKDIYNTAGIRTTAHSKLLRAQRAHADAPYTVKSGPTRARSCWGSSRRMSSRSAVRPSTCRGHHRAIPGTRTTSPAARPPALERRSQPG